MEPRHEPVDYRTLDGLRALAVEADAGLVDAVLGDFLEGTPGRLEALAQHAARGAWAEAARGAHALAGSAGTVGAEELRRLARALEVALDAGRTDDAAGPLSALGAAFARARPLLEAWRAGAAAP